MSIRRTLTAFLILILICIFAYVYPQRSMPTAKQETAVTVTSKQKTTTEPSIDMPNIQQANDSPTTITYDEPCEKVPTKLVMQTDYEDSEKAYTLKLADTRHLAEAQLAESSLDEHLHVGALLTRHAHDRITKLKQAFDTNPNNTMALWQAFFMCSELQSPDACPLQKWEQKLLSIDGQNGQTWMRIAVNRYSNGAYDEALQAVRRAGTSPDSQLYWIESVDVLQKGFASTGLFTKHEELMIGLKKVYVANPILSGHTMMCDEQSKDSIEWAEACLAYGELTASMGRNRRTQELGKSIQVSALKSLGNHDRARSVENEFQRTDHKYNALFRQLEGQIEGDDPRFLDEYPHILVNALDKMRSESEMAGITYLAEEVDRLVLAQAATGCKPTNE